MLSPSALSEDGRTISVCNDCTSVLDRNRKPKLAISNGLYIGRAADIAALASLTIQEQLLLSNVRTRQYVQHLDASRPSKSIFDVKLRCHWYGFECSPDEVAAIAAADDGNSFLKVHLTVGSLEDPEGRAEAIRKAKEHVKINKARFIAAFNWLCDNNPSYAELQVNVDAVELLEKYATEDEHGELLLNGCLVVDDEWKSDSDAESKEGRASLLASSANLNVGVGDRRTFAGTGVLVDTWNPEKLPLMYPILFPFGTGGPTTTRAQPVGLDEYVAHTLRLSNRAFGQSYEYVMERCDTMLRASAIETSHKTLIYNPKVKKAAIKVTEDELKKAQSYHDLYTKATANHKRPPDKPADITADAEMLVRSLASSRRYVVGTPENASRERNKYWSLLRETGNFSLWATITPDDKKLSGIARIAQHGPTGRLPPEDEQCKPCTPETELLVNSDPAACAIYHRAIVSILKEHIVGWDDAKFEATGNGFFGNASSFAFATEEQQRLSLHVHALIGLLSCERTTSDLVTTLCAAARDQVPASSSNTSTDDSSGGVDGEQPLIQRRRVTVTPERLVVNSAIGTSEHSSDDACAAGPALQQQSSVADTTTDGGAGATSGAGAASGAGDPIRDDGAGVDDGAIVTEFHSKEAAEQADTFFGAVHPAGLKRYQHSKSDGTMLEVTEIHTGERACRKPPASPLVCDDATHTHGPWAVSELDSKYSEVSEPSPRLSKPLNAECITCGKTSNYMSTLRHWALSNLTAELRTIYNSGNVHFEDTDLDTSAFYSGSSIDLMTPDQRATMAAITLIGIHYLEHDHCHRFKCFKGGKLSSAKKRCRFLLPASCQSETDSYIVCFNTGEEPTVDDVMTIAVETSRPRGYEFTAEHNRALLFTFRCNTHSRYIGGSPNMIFYTTCYASKAPEGKPGHATALAGSLGRCTRRQATQTLTDDERGQSIFRSLLNASTGHCVELGVTSCAMLLLNGGTLFDYSHKFAPLLVSQAIDYVQGKPFRAAPIQLDDPDNMDRADRVDAELDETGTSASAGAAPARIYTVVPQVLSYQFRSYALASISYHQFAGSYYVKKGVLKKDVHCSKYVLLAAHPQHKTHFIQRRRHAYIPNHIGTRIRNRRCFRDADGASNLESYCLHALVVYKPWGGQLVSPATTSGDEAGAAADDEPDSEELAAHVPLRQHADQSWFETYEQFVGRQEAIDHALAGFGCSEESCKGEKHCRLAVFIQRLRLEQNYYHNLSIANRMREAGIGSADDTSSEPEFAVESDPGDVSAPMVDVDDEFDFAAPLYKNDSTKPSPAIRSGLAAVSRSLLDSGHDNGIFGYAKDSVADGTFTPADGKVFLQTFDDLRKTAAVLPLGKRDWKTPISVDSPHLRSTMPVGKANRLEGILTTLLPNYPNAVQKILGSIGVMYGAGTSVHDDCKALLIEYAGQSTCPATFVDAVLSELVRTRHCRAVEAVGALTCVPEKRHGAKDATTNLLPPLRPNIGIAQALQDCGLDGDADQSRAFSILAASLLRGYIKLGLATTDSAQYRFIESTLAAVNQRLSSTDNHEQLILFLSGQGGSGKSRVIRSVQAFAKAWGMSDLLLVTSTTGTSALNISGVTIDSVAGNHTRQCFPDQKFESDHLGDLSDIALIIVDEVSFMPAGSLGAFSTHIAVKKGCTGADISRLPFGGIDIAFAGDLMQLPPVKRQKPIFDIHNDFYPTQKDKPVTEIQAVGVKIWSKITHVVLLTKNYRAASDPDYAAFLTNHRSSNMILPRHLACLKGRQIATARRNGQSQSPSITIPPNATWSFHTNRDVAAANSVLCHVSAGLAKQPVYRFTAEIRSKKSEAPIHRPNEPALVPFLVGDGLAANKDLSKTSSAMSHLDIHIGAKLMFFTGNSGNKGGVANGSQGYFIDTSPPLSSLDYVEEEVVLGDGSKARVRTLKKLPTDLLLWVPNSTVLYQDLARSMVPVPIVNKKYALHGHSQKRWISQFEVRHCHSFTIHKLQGLEATTGLVVGALSKRDLNFIYVALSRVRSWKRLYLLPFLRLELQCLTLTAKDGSRHQLHKLRDEIARLKKIAECTTAFFKKKVNFPSQNK